MWTKETQCTPLAFQVMSDLHFEVGQQYPDFQIPPSAPYLILAGDFGCLMDYAKFCDFLQAQCANFSLVFLVLGNHEFFGVSRQEGLDLADRMQQEDRLKDRLVIMNRRRVDVEDVTVLGCTLQSFIPSQDAELVGYKINDFHHIKE